MTTATANDRPAEKEKKKQPRDPAREVVETVVFVVVLVLLLKLFVTEAFVIPTGSMAETLYGYQKIIVCPECGHEFPVNSHDEVEGVPQQNGGPKKPQPLVKYVCPNCRFHGLISKLNPIPGNRTGDRVLVLKPLYHIREPQRGDVVVFKYPKAPQENHIAANYIKRAMGFGNETIAIHRGDLYVTTTLEYPEGELYPRPADPLDLWQPQYMHANSGQAEKLFEASRKAGFPAGPIKNLPPELRAHFKPLLDEGFSPEKSGFVVIRKGEQQLLADRRVVWNNDEQPKLLAGVLPPRWYPLEAGAVNWRGDAPQQPRAFGHTGESLDWIRYRNFPEQWKTAAATPSDPTPETDLAVFAKQQPRFVDNFLGYNSGRNPFGLDATQFWVGDLILECEAEMPAGSEVVLELSRGVNRFQAAFGKGQVSLKRIGPKGPEFGNPSRPCKVNGGTYRLRFANVDSRLWVWVDGKRIDFGTEGEYSPAEPDKYEDADKQKQGWTQANDVDAPASIGARGEVTAIRHIKLDRDIYYTWYQEHYREGRDQTMADIYYVQPGHYMCMGDNSAHSSDSREWGTVPQRLMLGKAVFVFWPALPPPNRVGFIH